MLVMEFAHKNLSGPADQISAMMRVKDMISQSNFSGKVFAFSKEYAAWETDQVSHVTPMKWPFLLISSLSWSGDHGRTVSESSLGLWLHHHHHLNLAVQLAGLRAGPLLCGSDRGQRGWIHALLG